MSLVDVASKLAAALRLMPCTCIEIGSWPLFKAEAAGSPAKPGKHVPKTCHRCAALALYDAHVELHRVARSEPPPSHTPVV